MPSPEAVNMFNFPAHTNQDNQDEVNSNDEKQKEVHPLHEEIFTIEHKVKGKYVKVKEDDQI